MSSASESIVLIDMLGAGAVAEPSVCYRNYIDKYHRVSKTLADLRRREFVFRAQDIRLPSHHREGPRSRGLTMDC